MQSIFNSIKALLSISFTRPINGSFRLAQLFLDGEAFEQGKRVEPFFLSRMPKERRENSLNRRQRRIILDPSHLEAPSLTRSSSTGPVYARRNRANGRKEFFKAGGLSDLCIKPKFEKRFGNLDGSRQNKKRKVGPEQWGF
jgi:hypothetical protein